MRARKATIVASIGNILEFYDFGLYGFYATLFSKLFFPLENPLNSLLLSFAVFAVGFMCRPFGAILFGYIGDRFSRRTTLCLSLTGIGVATLCIGLLPTYASWGIYAPLSLTLCRIIQSICLGGEYSNSLIFVSEHLAKHKARHPALIVGIVSSMGTLGWFTASVLAMIFTTYWRIPFFFGSLIAISGLYIRTHTEDALPKPPKPPRFCHIIRRSLQYPRGILISFAVGSLMGALFYGQFIFCTSYLPRVTPFTQTQIRACVTIGLFAYMLFLPLLGFIGDRIGHLRLMTLASFLTAILALPLVYLETIPSLPIITLTMILVAAILSSFFSPGSYYMTLSLPPDVRCFGVSLSYNLGATLFGGLAPPINLILYRTFNTPLAPAAFLTFTALFTLTLLLATKRVPETTHS